MFKYIYFIGTGCGRPLLKRQLPTYLIGLEEKHSILVECGCIINTDDDLFPLNLAHIDTIIISAPEIELYAGMPSLLHSMRLLNRTKTLRVIAPKVVNRIFNNLVELDNLNKEFEIQFINIEQHKSTKLISNFILYTKKANVREDRYQIYLKGNDDKDIYTIFYTGKSTAIPERNLLTGRQFIIHDCTYSYDDWELTKKTGLASYKNVLEFNKKFDPEIIFLVHFSTRYKNPLVEIMKHRIKPNNILTTYDGYRFDLLNLRGQV